MGAQARPTNWRPWPQSGWRRDLAALRHARDQPHNRCSCFTACAQALTAETRLGWNSRFRASSGARGCAHSYKDPDLYAKPGPPAPGFILQAGPARTLGLAAALKAQRGAQLAARHTAPRSPHRSKLHDARHSRLAGQLIWRLLLAEAGQKTSAGIEAEADQFWRRPWGEISRPQPTTRVNRTGVPRTTVFHSPETCKPTESAPDCCQPPASSGLGVGAGHTGPGIGRRGPHGRARPVISDSLLRTC